MTLTPLSRRRMSDLWVGLMLVTSMAALTVVAGCLLGTSVRPHTYKCPVVEGAKPVSSADSKDGQWCSYTNESSYGRAIHKVRL